MDGNNKKYQDEENAGSEDYDDEDEYEEGNYRPHYPRINWWFMISSTIVLQAGALGAIKSNIYLLIGSTILAGICALFVTWKEKIADVTYTPNPNKYKLFFAFLFVAGIVLSIAVIAQTIRW